MKKFSVLLMAAMLSGAPAFVAGAQEKAGTAKEAKPGGVIVDVIKLTGTVKAVDLDKKTATVEGSGGRTVVVNAKNARNLDQVKVGDKVNLEFLDSIALFVRKSDTPPSATETQAVALAPKGQRPTGIVAETIELTGNVESIDAKKRTIAVKGPAGNVRTFKVGPEAKNFAQIKKGDQVVLRFTEAIACLGGSALDNEEAYPLAKLMRALGLVYLEHQARL
jgi:Cu/Ag efflux protein CusF